MRTSVSPWLPDTAYVSVGHRSSLLGYHDKVLRLEAGAYTRPLFSSM